MFSLREGGKPRRHHRKSDRKRKVSRGIEGVIGKKGNSRAFVREEEKA